MTEPNEGKIATKPKASRHRSPAYPSLNLWEAVQKAETLYRDHHLHPVPVEAAVKNWGFDGLSGVGARAISALKQFGLLEEAEENGSRRVRLSVLGRQIVQLSQDDPRRKEAISEAAKKPAIHIDLLEQYPTRLPPDPALKSYLEYHRNFNRNAVEPLIKEIRDTWSFAQIEESGTMPDIMGEDQHPQEGHGMITTGAARQGGSPAPPQIPDARVQFVELQIPEVGGHTSILRTAPPATVEELDYLRRMIDHYLEGWKEQIERRLARQREPGKDS